MGESLHVDVHVTAGLEGLARVQIGAPDLEQANSLMILSMKIQCRFIPFMAIVEYGQYVVHCTLYSDIL